VPVKEESVRQVLPIAKQPLAMETPSLKVEVALPVWAKFRTERPPEKVEVPCPAAKVTAPAKVEVVTLVTMRLVSVEVPAERVPAPAMLPWESMVVVAVPPKYAFWKVENWVVEAAPLKSIREVVALCPDAGCVNSSRAAREEEETLLLKVVQSADARHPAWEPLAVWQPREPPEPICVKLPVRGEEAERVEVATLWYTPEPPP